MRPLYAVFAITTLSALACGGGENTVVDQTVTAGVDVDAGASGAEGDSLDGKWTVTSCEVDYVFEVNGFDMTITDYQYSEAKTVTGKITMGENEVTVKPDGGWGSTYHFARSDKGLHFGNSDVMKVDDLENMTLKIGMFESIVRTPTSCKWQKDFQGIKEKTVECEVIERFGLTVFRYQEPDPFDDAKVRDKYLYKVGDYLMKEDMAFGRAHPG